MSLFLVKSWKGCPTASGPTRILCCRRDPRHRSLLFSLGGTLPAWRLSVCGAFPTWATTISSRRASPSVVHATIVLSQYVEGNMFAPGVV